MQSFMCGSITVLFLWINLVHVEAVEKPLDIFESFEYGKLDSTHLHQIADSITQGNLSTELHWLADTTQFFSFKSTDDVVLQAYYIPGNLSSCSEDSSLNDIANCSVTPSVNVIKPIVFMAGWTETTTKYAKFLHQLHNKGHDIFSYDLRGQGFSSASKHTAEGRKISHVVHFNEFVDDLAHFITKVMPEQLHLHTSNKYINHKIVPHYVGFSLSGLIGLTLENLHPEILSTENKMVLLAPCIKPVVGVPFADMFFKGLRFLGLSDMLVAKIKLDDPFALRSHSAPNTAAYHEFLNSAPKQLKIAGPSVGLLSEMMRASDELLQRAPHMDLNVLILQASHDVLVDNAAMHTFSSTVGVNLKQQKLAVSAESTPETAETATASTVSSSAAQTCEKDGDAMEREVRVSTSSTVQDTPIEAVREAEKVVGEEEVVVDTPPATTANVAGAAISTTGSTAYKGSGGACSSSSGSGSGSSGGSSGGRVVRLENAYHLLMDEVDHIFEAVLAEVLAHLEDNSANHN